MPIYYSDKKSILLDAQSAMCNYSKQKGQFQWFHCTKVNNIALDQTQKKWYRLRIERLYINTLHIIYLFTIKLLCKFDHMCPYRTKPFEKE